MIEKKKNAIVET